MVPCKNRTTASENSSSCYEISHSEHRKSHKNQGPERAPTLAFQEMADSQNTVNTAREFGATLAFQEMADSQNAEVLREPQGEL